MSKLIYAKSKAGFETAFTDRTITGPVYSSVVFTEDGSLFTHGQYFRIFPDTNPFDITYASGAPVATGNIVSLKDSSGNELTSFDIGVTDVSGDTIIGASRSNGTVSLTHASRGSAGANTYGVAEDTNGLVTIPIIKSDGFGHVTSNSTTFTSYVNRVKSTIISTAADYYITFAGTTDGTTELNKNSNLKYNPNTGTLTASKLAGTLNTNLTITLNGTGTVFDNSASKSVSFYAPTSAGTSKQILMSNGSGAPSWYSPVTTVSAASTNNDIPTAAAVWAVVGNGMAANDAMVFKGTIAATGVITSGDATINGKTLSQLTNYSSGWTFKAAEALTITGVGTLEIGDMVIGVKDYATAYAASDWTVVQANIDGAVTSSVTLTTGQLIIGANGKSVSVLSPSSDGQVLTQVSGVPAWANPILNTAGTTNLVGTKLFLAGATSQAASPQTYSNVNVYIGTDNKLYSNNSVVLTTADVVDNLTSSSTSTPLSANQGRILNNQSINAVSLGGNTITLTKKDATTITATVSTLSVDTTGIAYKAVQQVLATCATDAATAAKVVTLSGFALIAGAKIIIQFTNAATASATLNVNGTGAKTLYYNGAVTTASTWAAGDFVEVQYDGTQFHVIFVNSDNSTNKPVLAGDITGNATTVTTIAASGNAYLFGSTSAVGANSSVMRSANVYMNGGTLYATTFSGALSGTASSATNLAGGAKGNIVYQSAAGTTAYLANGSNGQVLKFNTTTGLPEWGTDINTWRNVTAYTGGTSQQVLSTSIGTADLAFGSDFIWTSSTQDDNAGELKIGWAEVDVAGVVTYAY